MLRIKFTKKFKKDYKLCIKRGCDPQKLSEVMELLRQRQQLPPEYLDHPLQNSRDYKDARECHLAPDWLLIYQINETELILRFLRTGSHSDVF